MKIRDVIGVIALVGGAVLLAVRPSSKKPAPPATVISSSPALPQKPASPLAFTTNFGTPWQDESQFIVQTIATDLAEMMVFAKSGRPPEGGGLKIEVTEMAARADGTIVYQVRAPSLQVEAELPITAAIWSPAVYQPFARALAKKIDLAASANVPADSKIAELTDLRAVVIERANAEVSAALEKDCASPALHERAALVLAAFTLREHSRLFFEIRTELCAMTAHLALAHALRAGGDVSVEGRLAEATLTSLYNNRVEALKLVGAIPADQPGVAAWQQALRTRNTRDYRLIKDRPEMSLLERIEKFKAEAEVLDTDQAWQGLSRMPEPLQELPDWMRIASSNSFGIGTGHELLSNALRAELAEIGQVYFLAQGESLTEQKLIAALNAEPGRCVGFAADGRPRVRVVGWGLWAAFLQRRLCQAITEDFRFMDKMWGVPDEALKFRQQVDENFWNLRLYPLVRRQNATDDTYYHRAQDESMALIRRQPHLIPAGIWNHVCYTVPFGALYIPPPHAFINEWHRHNPPPGTAYNPYPRMDHPSLMSQPDTVARLERLHALAPWDHDIAFFLIKKRHGENPTAEQLIEGYRAELEFAPDPMRKIARASEAKPAMYIEWMTRAAALNSSSYYPLAEYLVKQGREAEAATAYANAMARDVDSVRMANNAGWLVNYFEDHGQAAKATALADRAAETYSSRGLRAKAALLEKRKQYDEALEIYRAMAERYNTPGVIIEVLMRMQQTVPNAKFQTLLAKTIRDVVPGGLEKIEVSRLSGAPVDGIILSTENDETRKAGLRRTDVIVGVQGNRVHNFKEYSLLRELDGPVPLRLILWRENTYIALSASPPNHRFGLDFNDYHAKK